MIPIWLDCDPGHDDAVAILLAGKRPEFKLLGISTVYGNAPLLRTTVNAMAVLKAIGREDVPVYAGAEHAQSSVSTEKQDAEKCYGHPESGHYESAPSVFAPSIHGESGLDGTELLPKIVHPVEPDLTATLAAMEKAICDNPGTCLVATGSLTNVAALFEAYPHTKALIRTLSIMGGGFGIGNWTPYAEFNIWCDSHASKLVLEDPLICEKLVLAPLNVTHTAIANDDVLQRIKDIGTPVSQMFFELMTFFKHTYEEEFGFADGPPVHDPLSVAVLLPEIAFRTRKVGVTVVVEGDKRGMLVETDKGPKLKVLEEIDLDRFWDMVVDSLNSVALSEH